MIPSMRDSCLFLGLFSLVMMFLFSCAENDFQEGNPTLKKETTVELKIGKDEALEIAEQDARTAYRDLSIYEVETELVSGNWQIDYELKDKSLRGGGPHYLISGQTGEIISKRYEQ
jgi:hypothetical protein